MLVGVFLAVMLLQSAFAVVQLVSKEAPSAAAAGPKPGPAAGTIKVTETLYLPEKEINDLFDASSKCVGTTGNCWHIKDREVFQRGEVRQLLKERYTYDGLLNRFTNYKGEMFYYSDNGLLIIDVNNEAFL